MRSARAVPGALVLIVALVAGMLAGPALADESEPAADPVRVMVVGDSITQGSSGDYTWRYRLWQGMTASGAQGVELVGHRDDLWDNVGDGPGSQHYAAPFAQTRHAALWGTSFQRENPLIEDRVRAAGADVVLIQLGHNDLRYFTSPAQTADAAAAMVAAVRRANPAARIVLGEVVTGWDFWNRKEALSDESAGYATRLRSLVNDLSTPTSPVELADTRASWSAETDTYDGSHASPSGEIRLAQAYLRALHRLGVIPSLPVLAESAGWAVPGPPPELEVTDEGVRVSWSRVSTGATAMVLRYRTGDRGWTQLPDAIGSVDAWTLPAAPGTTYEVQLAPRKWTLGGQFGPSAFVRVPGAEPTPSPTAPTPPPPTTPSPSSPTPPQTPARVSAVTVAISGASVTARWTLGPGARPSGYAVGWGYRTPGSTAVQGWTELPGVSTGSSRVITGVPPGTFVVVGVQPLTGTTRGARVHAATIRVPGVARAATQVAIGDDEAAGTGVPAAGQRYLDSCRRSGSAWVHQALREATAKAVNLGCSGSVMSHLTATPGTDPRTGQLARLRSAFAAAPTRGGRVLISVGDNDLKLRDKATFCVLNACGDREQRWMAEVEALRPRMRETFRQVQSASPNADRYLVLRRPLVSSAVTTSAHPICAGLGPDGAVIARLSARLNVVLAQEAKAYGIRVGPTPSAGTWNARSWCGAAGPGASWVQYPTVGGKPPSVTFAPRTGQSDARSTQQRAGEITAHLTSLVAPR